MKRIIKMLIWGICIAGLLSLHAFPVVAEGILRSNWSWPTQIDPAIGKDYSSTAALVNIYDTLVYPDADGNPIPHVASKWTLSADGKIWTFQIRKGIKFHDGSELTAEISV